MSSTPVQPRERIQYLDVLRGFAISGVLLAYIFWNLGTVPESGYSAFDSIINKTLVFLVDSKCFTILANLFTVGFVLHMNKSNETTKNLYTYRRRLAGLVIFGLIHATLLRNGDILLPYALLTLLVSFFYSASNLAIIAAMIATFFLEVMMPQIYTSLHIPFPQRPVTHVGSNYWVENFGWVRYWYSIAHFFWETNLVFLFSGLLVGRIFIQKKIKLTNRQLVLVALAGIILSSSIYYIVSYYENAIFHWHDIGKTFILRKTVYNIFALLHRSGMAAAYASLIYLILKRFPLGIFAALGRTSLSNYILQAVIVVPLCLWFNLFDHITPTIGLIMTVSIWTLQVMLSTWWLKTHRFGPLEWLLRRFTYGKVIESRKINPDIELVAVAERI